MSHDAATGYLKANRGVSSATNLYAKNQIGTVYDQLEDGARALDVRPKLLLNGTVVCHHGAISIPISLENLILDALRWSSEHPDELVLVLHHELSYESGLTPSADTAVNALSDVYSSLGVPYLECGDVYGLTVEETTDLAKVPSGGYMLALDRHDAYASSCAKLNYVTDELVTCYPNNTTPCTKQKSPAMENLKAYVLASANNEPSDNRNTLGPPASLEYYPFNALQALWQVDTHAAALGVAHASSIIDDNTKSQVNAKVVDWVYQGEFNEISLLMVDHVQLNGNALLSVLRTKCGQSELPEESCGSALAKPKTHQKHMSTLAFFLSLAVYVAFALWVLVMIAHYRRHYDHDEQIRRMQKDLQTAEDQFKMVRDGEFT